MASRNHYDSLAPFYDKVIGNNSSAKKFLTQTAKKYLPKNADILELGCGTAENLLQFAAKNNVTGIDISAGMLKEAKKKIPSGKFIRSDISDFHLNKKFDFIFCLYDTINHLNSFKEWQGLFKSVKAHLKENGVFIFDFNTLYKLNILAESDIYPEFSGDDVLLLNVKKFSANNFNWNIKFFNNTSTAKYTLFEENIHESGFETKKVLDEIKKNFKIIKTYNENFKPAAKNSLRIFCLAVLK